MRRDDILESGCIRLKSLKSYIVSTYNIPYTSTISKCNSKKFGTFMEFFIVVVVFYAKNKELIIVDI